MNDAFEKLRSLMPLSSDGNDAPPTPSSSAQSTSKCNICTNSNSSSSSCSAGGSRRNFCCNQCSVPDNTKTCSSGGKSNLTKITTLKLAVDNIATLSDILNKCQGTANDVSRAIDGEGNGQSLTTTARLHPSPQGMPPHHTKTTNECIDPTIRQEGDLQQTVQGNIQHNIQGNAPVSQMPVNVQSQHRSTTYQSSSPAPSSSNSSSWLSDWDPFSSPVAQLTPEVDDLVGDTFHLILESDEFQ